MSQEPQDIARVKQGVQDWWRTSIIDMAPGSIRYRGYPIQELIGNVSFAQMIWLRITKPAASRLSITVRACTPACQT